MFVPVASSSVVLLQQFVARKLELLATMRQVKRDTGKAELAQLLEIAQLRIGPGRLRASDYYGYGAFDDRLYSPSAKRELAGSSDGGRLSGLLNDRGWRALAADKLITYALLKGMDLPHPRPYALYHEHGRSFGAVPCLATQKSMAAFLRQEMTYPFFGKLVGGRRGAGATAIAGIDHGRDVLMPVVGDEIAVNDYIAKYVAPGNDGYLFQEVLESHPAVRRICGERVSTVRIVVLNADGVQRVHRAVWHIPVAGSITDHFRRGTSGNMVGHVVPETGIVAAVAGPTLEGANRLYGLGSRGARIECHPESGERLTGIRLPDWEAVLYVCSRAASAFPGLRYQSWDVALCPAGPVLVELNSSGGVMQIPGTPGFIDVEFRRFLSTHTPRRMHKRRPAR